MYFRDRTESQLRAYITSQFLPNAPKSDIDKLFTLYPGDITKGSPFDTGNQTFGLSSQFKRAAALLGDVSFQSQRRAWIQAASNRGVKTFAYLFTDHPPTLNPRLGGECFSHTSVFMSR